MESSINDDVVYYPMIESGIIFILSIVTDIELSMAFISKLQSSMYSKLSINIFSVNTYK